jgi:hypothetical protein
MLDEAQANAAEQQDAADKRRALWRASRAFINAPLAADLGVRRTQES